MNPRNESSRSREIERMDRPDAPEDRLFRTLGQFEIINRVFTRNRGAMETFILSAMRRAPGRRYRLADLGSGGCDLPRWLIRRCRREGLHLRVRAIELDPRIRRFASAANAEYPEIEVVAADALDADAWGRPDFIFANHLLHHLEDDVIVRMLGLLETSGARYILSDIQRSRWAAVPYAVLVGLLFHGGFLLEDGLASIRRGFHRHELMGYLARARLEGKVRLLKRFPFRWLLVGGPDGGRVAREDHPA